MRRRQYPVQHLRRDRLAGELPPNIPAAKDHVVQLGQLAWRAHAATLPGRATLAHPGRRRGRQIRRSLASVAAASTKVTEATASRPTSSIAHRGRSVYRYAPTAQATPIPQRNCARSPSPSHESTISSSPTHHSPSPTKRTPTQPNTLISSTPTPRNSTPTRATTVTDRTRSTPSGVPGQP